MMHGHEKSRSAIVAVKPTNKAERSAAESVERRAETKGNVDQQRTRRTQRRISVSQMLARIRQHIVAVETQGRSRMRESCTSGSVRGARGNSRPYRNRCYGAVVLAFERTRIELGVSRPGAKSEKVLKDVRLPTVWNQIEAAMAYTSGLPLLVLV